MKDLSGRRPPLGQDFIGYKLLHYPLHSSHNAFLPVPSASRDEAGEGEVTYLAGQEVGVGRIEEQGVLPT